MKLRRPEKEELIKITLKFYVDYEGHLYRLMRTCVREVTRTDKDGYIITALRINGKFINYKAHHICWFLYYGEWPIDQIDHKDAYRFNNQKDNLRQSNNTQQQLNTSRNLMFPGIQFRNGKYRVRIGKDGKRYNIGHFNTLDEAIKELKEAYYKLYGKYYA